MVVHNPLRFNQVYFLALGGGGAVTLDLPAIEVPPVM